MALKLAQRGGTQITAPQDNNASFVGLEYRTPERNAFNLSKQTHGSLQFGKIYPVYSRMVFPGDTFKIKESHFLRFAAVISPILNKINITTMAFYVPFRLVWKYWPTFITGGYNNDGVLTDELGNMIDKNGYPTTTPFAPQPPTFNALDKPNGVDDVPYPGAVIDGGLGDWLGFPTFEAESDFIDARENEIENMRPLFSNMTMLPFMCYQKVVNDWLTNNNIVDSSRDKSLPPSSVYGLVPFDDTLGEFAELAYINYGLDYFTSCLPRLQRGDALTLNSTDDQITFDNTGDQWVFKKGRNEAPGEPNLMSIAGALHTTPLNAVTPQEEVNLNVVDTLKLQYHTTIQELRFLNAMQRWQEKSLRVGTRYIDFLKCYFGVKSSDRSLQRSEFIGASVDAVVKNDIDQTSETTQSGTPLGTVASKLIGVGSSKSFDCYCEEHGMIFVMAVVTPETIYKNRMRTEWLYKDKFDFLFPEFTHLSPQAVKNAELYVPRDVKGFASYNGLANFGYQDRFNELRCDTNDVHGDFKNSLSFFLQMRNFNATPRLNTNFLKADDIDTSIFATDTIQDAKGQKHKVDHIWASFNFDVKAVRPLPKLATPSLI